jgi:hypothetical protein
LEQRNYSGHGANGQFKPHGFDASDGVVGDDGIEPPTSCV